MRILPVGMIMDQLAGGFGVAAAVLIVGGAILLRWQRNRQRFELMKTALENGVTRLPTDVPFWLISLREALTILTVGIALIGVGLASWVYGAHVPVPSNEQLRQAAEMRPPPPPPQDGPPEDQRGPDQHGPDQRGPGPRNLQNGNRPGPQNPPPPEVERWHRGQAMVMIGMLSIGCGAILALLGMVRTMFASVERRYSAAISSGPSGSAEA